MLFFEAVMKLRSSRCGVRIEAAVPCPTEPRGLAPGKSDI